MAKYVIKKGSNGQYWFVLKSANGQTVVTSEMYTTKQACKDGITFVKTNAAGATTDDETGER